MYFYYGTITGLFLLWLVMVTVTVWNDEMGSREARMYLLALVAIPLWLPLLVIAVIAIVSVALWETLVAAVGR